jgi:mRNA interferase MazF
VVQADAFNASRIGTVIVAAVTSNTALATLPGNVFVPAAASGLAKDSVVNVSALVTLDKKDLDEPVGRLPARLMAEVDEGLRLVLGL